MTTQTLLQKLKWGGVALATSLLLASSAPAKTYQLGGLYTLTYSNGLYADWGDYARISAQMAVDDVNRSGMMGEDKLELNDKNILDFHCAMKGSKELGEDIFSRGGILAVLGLDCSGPSENFANSSTKYKVPAVSYGAGAEPLGDMKEFPYFVRVLSPSSVFERVFFDVMTKYDLDDLAIFNTTDIWGASAKEALVKDASEMQFSIGGTYSYDRNTSFEKVYYYLSKAKAQGLKNFFIIMPVPDTAVFFQAVKALKMDTPGYTYCSSEILSPNNAQMGLLGAIGNFAPKTTFPEGPALDDYIKRLSEKIGKPITPDSSAFLWGILGYDNVRLVAEAVALAKKDGVKEISGETLMPYLRQGDYMGLTGRINIEKGTNNRQSMDIDILNFQGYVDDASYASRWLYTIKNPSGPAINYVKVGKVDSEGTFTFDESKVLWPGETKTPPTGKE
jgi:ABC-type branched-subunit amino acid transport system substrate-binding protein